MNIIISGLTAAGKTTTATVLAHLLAFDYQSASRTMLRMLTIDAKGGNDTWTTRMEEIQSKRDSSDVDARLNDALRAEVRRTQLTVFDSWSLPWLADDDTYRIWIESSLDSRALKVRASQEPKGPFLSLADCLALASRKDADTVDRFKLLLGVDISTDRTPFDLVVDFSPFMTGATIDAAYRGIQLSMPHLAARLSSDDRFRGGVPRSSIASLDKWLATRTD